MKFIKSVSMAFKKIRLNLTRRLNALKSFFKNLSDAVKAAIIAGVFTILGVFLGTEPWKVEEPICNELSIKVLENYSNAGVHGAKIRFKNLKDQEGYTDENGIYRFTLSKEPDQITVIVSKDMYEEVTKIINLDSLYILPISIKIQRTKQKLF